MQLIEKQLERRGSYKCKTLIMSNKTDKFEFRLITEKIVRLPHIKPTLMCDMSGANMSGSMFLSTELSDRTCHLTSEDSTFVRIENATASYIAPTESISVSSRIEELEHEVQLLWELLERHGIIGEGERHAARND